MYCKNCGAEIKDGQPSCQNCGAAILPDNMQSVPNPPMPAKHDVPRCTCCGYVGPWKLAPILRPIDWIIAICLFFFFGAGIVYLLITAAVRSNKNNRAKICPNCKAQNLWTFIY